MEYKNKYIYEKEKPRLITRFNMMFPGIDIV